VVRRKNGKGVLKKTLIGRCKREEEEKGRRDSKVVTQAEASYSSAIVES